MLGLLIYSFPKLQSTTLKVNKVIDTCYRTLEQNFNTSLNAKDPELLSIAGAFSCLDRCLMFFPDQCMRENHKNLWSYLMKACMKSSSDDLNRFSMISKALRLLKKHAHKFHAYIGLNVLSTFDAVAGCCFSGKSALEKHSEDALNAVLEEMASYVKRERNEETIGHMSGLKVAFLECLDSGNRKVNKSEEGKSIWKKLSEDGESAILLAVIGFSSISQSLPFLHPSNPSTTAISLRPATDSKDALSPEQRMQVEAVQEVLRAIINSSQQYFLLSDSNNEEHIPNKTTVLKKAQFLTALSCTVSAELDLAATLPPSSEESYSVLAIETQEHLKELAMAVAMHFTELGARQAIAAKRALRLLIYALAKSHKLFQNVCSSALVPALLYRSISRADITSPFHGPNNGRLYETYALLWSDLLSSNTNREGEREFGCDRRTESSDRSALATDDATVRLFDALIEQSMTTLSTLDLTYARETSENGETSENHGDNETESGTRSVLAQ